MIFISIAIDSHRQKMIYISIVFDYQEEHLQIEWTGNKKYLTNCSRNTALIRKTLQKYRKLGYKA